MKLQRGQPVEEGERRSGEEIRVTRLEKIRVTRGG